jgi:SAM-dependent methyltransferase
MNLDARESTVIPMPKKKKKKKAKHRGPESTDRHRLYEDAVQSPEEHIRWFDQFFEEKNGRLPISLKEDFCGTALLSAEWVRKRPGNVAVGVDLDLETLDWARENNIHPLDKDQQSRVTLLHRDVMEIVEPKVDIVAALNFSYFEFKTRDALRSYFERARESLAPGGVLILDMFGGWEAQMEETDRTRYKGFTYVWEQKSFDPISHLTEFHIHFKFHDGGGIKSAFVYRWRLWTLPEVRELLAEAGFKKVDIYWEGTDDDTGEGNGEYELVTEAENMPGWIAFIVASPE